MLRDHIRGLIKTRLDLDETTQVDLEKGIYNASIQDAKRLGARCHWENPEFIEVYKGVARRTLVNLIPDQYIGNGRLLERLKDGEFPAHQIPFMTAREMYPENWQVLADEQLKRETTMLDGNPEEGSDMFTCKRCKKSRTRYWEMQTRSADEPMTIFIRCLNCGKEWRQ